MVRLKTDTIQTQIITEDAKRRSYILDVFLRGLIFVTGLALAALVFRSITSGRVLTSPLYILVVLLLITFARSLNKRGKYKIVSYLLVMLFSFLVVFAFWSFGPNLPQALLIMTFVIVISGALVSNKFAILITSLLCGALIIITQLNISGAHTPSVRWQDTRLSIYDSIISVAIFIIILSVSVLFNSQLQKSIIIAKKSEAKVRKERDLLEVRVEERTKELRETQIQALTQVYHFAEFGKLASGIYHDLMNPLSSISLNLEHLNEKDLKKVSGAKEYFREALRISHQMENFLVAIKRQIQKQDSKEIFSLNTEADYAISVVAYRAQKQGVEIIKKFDHKISLEGNPLKFNQLITNLLTNAIDAYDGLKGDLKPIELDIRNINSDLIIKVKDRGCGIKPGDLDHIFEPLFTTKGISKGSGLGLSIVKSIVNQDFSGTITATSEGGETEFTVIIPGVKS